MNRFFELPRLLRSGRHTRSVAAFLVGIAALVGWGFYGANVISSLNPRLGHELAIAEHPALDVWITKPAFAGNAPLIISTPAGVRFEHDTITVPQGSIVSAHLAEQDGDAPELVVDDDSSNFTTDDHGDFAATTPLLTGKKLSIRRGWITLASWKINVIADNPPKVAMTEAPSVTESKALRLSYSASDEFGVTDIALRVTPHDTLPGADNMPVDIALPMSAAKTVQRVDFADLTNRPWTGQSVQLQIVATNQSGKQSLSAPIEFTLPERHFFHPVARLLIDERKKLMQQPDDEKLREETANIMAGIAHETSNFHGDPVVMMALRTGAVRLVLARDHSAAVSVGDILWQAAARIEDGASGSAQHILRDAQQDLANALDRNSTSQQEIESLTDRLQTAMDHYLQTLSSPTDKHRQADRTSDITREIQQIMDRIRHLSVSKTDGKNGL